MITKEEIKINDIGPKRGSNSEVPNNADNSHHDAAAISKKVANNAIFSTRILCSRITLSG
jgi:hypothetical protein